MWDPGQALERPCGSLAGRWRPWAVSGEASVPELAPLGVGRQGTPGLVQVGEQVPAEVETHEVCEEVALSKAWFSSQQLSKAVIAASGRKVR